VNWWQWTPQLSLAGKAMLAMVVVGIAAGIIALFVSHVF